LDRRKGIRAVLRRATPNQHRNRLREVSQPLT
jgi:hypothetical protein